MQVLLWGLQRAESFEWRELVQTLEFIMNYGDKGKILLDFLGGEPL